MTSDIGKKTIKSSMYGPIIPSPTAIQCAILISLVSFRFISFRGGVPFRFAVFIVFCLCFYRGRNGLPKESADQPFLIRGVLRLTGSISFEQGKWLESSVPQRCRLFFHKWLRSLNQAFMY